MITQLHHPCQKGQLISYELSPIVSYCFLVDVTIGKQECIPVRGVPSAAVAAGGRGVYPNMHWAGGCVSQHALDGGVYPSMHWAGGCLPRGV